jgi:hypothetical protein
VCPIIGCVVSDKLTILGAIGCKRPGDDCGIGSWTDPGTNTWGPQPAAPERMKRARHRNWPCFTRNSTRPDGDTETRPEYDSEAPVEATVLPKLPCMDGQEAAWSSAYPDCWFGCVRGEQVGGGKYKKPESESWFDENPSSIISSYQVLYQLYQYPPNQTNFPKPAPSNHASNPPDNSGNMARRSCGFKNSGCTSKEEYEGAGYCSKRKYQTPATIFAAPFRLYGFMIQANALLRPLQSV